MVLEEDDMTLAGWWDRWCQSPDRRLGGAVRQGAWLAVALSGWLAWLILPRSPTVTGGAASLATARVAMTGAQQAEPAQVPGSGDGPAVDTASDASDTSTSAQTACKPCGEAAAATLMRLLAADGEGGKLVIGSGTGGMCLGRSRGRPGVMKISQGKAKTLGQCAFDDIAKNVRARAGSLRACYEAELETMPEIAGTLVVDWVINSDGRVQGESIASDDMDSGVVRACVLRTVRRISFQKPESGSCWTQWKLQFKPR
jgi:hypothetical protein